MKLSSSLPARKAMIKTIESFNQRSSRRGYRRVCSGVHPPGTDLHPKGRNRRQDKRIKAQGYLKAQGEPLLARKGADGQG